MRGRAGYIHKYTKDLGISDDEVVYPLFYLRHIRINRLSHTDHVDPETGSACHLTQWCEQELRDMHIRRLGVLLIEIATGSPVYEVFFNRLENDVEIDFDDGASESKTTDILQRVSREGSEDLRDAIRYCLKQGTLARDIGPTDLESFYDHVIEP